MSAPVVLGAFRTAFGRTANTGRSHAVNAVRGALKDAGITWEQVGAAFGGSDAAGNADTLVTELGLTGLPFVNVKNGCATGGSALVSAANAIASGMAEIVVAVGFDKHPSGAFNPLPEEWGLDASYGTEGLMVTTQFFGIKIKRYMHDHGISERTLALVAEKAYRNGALHPLAWRRQPLTADEILASDMVSDPLTRYMFCSPGEGAAAVVLAAPQFARKTPGPTVTLDAVVLRSRPFGSFEVFSPSISAGDLASVSSQAASAAFAAAGISPSDVDVLQLQDTESGAEIMHLAECGFCEPGEQEELYARGVTSVDGRLPVNTDGGCLANGEPIGASGLRQVVEVVQQLRGRGGELQVTNSPKVGFTHVYGAPGVSACAVLSR